MMMAMIPRHAEAPGTSRNLRAGGRPMMRRRPADGPEMARTSLKSVLGGARTKKPSAIRAAAYAGTMMMSCQPALDQQRCAIISTNARGRRIAD
jgi:hypothetical protein